MINTENCTVTDQTKYQNTDCIFEINSKGYNHVDLGCEHDIHYKYNKGENTIHDVGNYAETRGENKFGRTVKPFFKYLEKTVEAVQELAE